MGFRVLISLNCQRKEYTIKIFISINILMVYSYVEFEV